MAVLAQQRQKAEGRPLTWTRSSSSTDPGRAGIWAGRPRALFAAGFSETQPISLMQRQERGLRLKLTCKSQNAVFKENCRPRDPGRAEGISGATSAYPSSGRERGLRLAASRGYAKIMIPTAPQTWGGVGGEL